MKVPIEIPLPGLAESGSNEKFDSQHYFSLAKETEQVWLKYIYEFIGEWINEKDFVELKTSGSTGTPKIIPMKKKAMLFSASQTNSFFNLQRSNEVLLCLPAEFIAGKMMIVRAILGGMKLFAVEPKVEIPLSENHSFAFAAMIPLQVKNYILNPNFKIDTVIIGGAAVSPALETEIRMNKSSHFWATYGMTETVSHVALRKMNGENANEFFSPMKNVLVGKDERNCLTIYNSNYSKNVIVTNDIVEFNHENCFKIIGRWDNVINSGGLKIVPEELEEKINTLIENRVLIVGIEDENLGQKLVLLVEGKEWDRSTLALFRNSLESILDKNKVPKEIYFLDSFIETDTGKINRSATRKLL